MTYHDHGRDINLADLIVGNGGQPRIAQHREQLRTGEDTLQHQLHLHTGLPCFFIHSICAMRQCVLTIYRYLSEVLIYRGLVRTELNQ